jgi:hypothetical protein
MEEEGVSLQEPEVAETVVAEMQQEAPDVPEVVEEEKEVAETRVPLSALQKERKKRQELEMQIEYERQQRAVKAQPHEEEIDTYESATKGDLRQVTFEAVRAVEEKSWFRDHPEKYEYVMENLTQFLQQRPNLAGAIGSATNRYEEAWTLMEALTPKQKQQMKQPTQKKASPNSPAAIPKAASMNQAVDLMSMSDKEFAEWRAQKRRR